MHRLLPPYPRRLFVCAGLLLAVIATGASASSAASKRFLGGFESRSIQPWESVQYEEDRPLDESFQIVSSPVRQGRYAAKIVVRQGYSRWGYGEDTELTWQSGEKEGDDYWYAWSTLFPTDWVAPSGWGIFMQWHARLDTSPPVSFDARMDTAVLYVHGGATNENSFQYSRAVPLLSTLSKGRWNDFVVHVHWSSGNSGAVEVWHRVAGGSGWRRVADLRRIPTLQRTSAGTASNYTLWGLYRASLCPQPTQLGCTSPRGTQPDNVLYEDGFARGTSFDEVSRSAFGERDSRSAAARATPEPKRVTQPATGRPWRTAGPTGARVDGGCSGCRVVVGKTRVAASVAGPADSGDTAFAVLKLARPSAWAAGLAFHDAISLSTGDRAAGNLALAQLRDVRRRVIWELYAADDRTLRLWSPPGGLRPEAVNVTTGSSVPAVGSRPLHVVVVLRPTRLTLWVEGIQRFGVGRRSTPTTPGFLRVGIDHYDGSPPAPGARALHAGLLLGG